MDGDRTWDELGNSSSVNVLLPPESLKPKEGFKRLLSEYQLWIRHNQDRGYAAFLTATRDMDLSENTSWEIRQTIRRMEMGPPIPKEDLSLKWHLILHLANKIEEDRVEAGEILNHLKKQSSPLKEALGEATPVQGLLDDLSVSESQPLMDKSHLRQTFEAWIGLFGGYLSDIGFLITIDRYVIDLATDIYEEQDLLLSKKPKEPLPPELTSSQNHIILKHLPRISDADNIHRDPVLKKLSGKTIILLDN
jgi:hypothetical protein